MAKGKKTKKNKKNGSIWKWVLYASGGIILTLVFVLGIVSEQGAKTVSISELRSAEKAKDCAGEKIYFDLKESLCYNKISTWQIFTLDLLWSSSGQCG